METNRNSFLHIVIAVVVTAILTFLASFLFMTEGSGRRLLLSADSNASTQSASARPKQKAYQAKLEEIQAEIDRFFIGKVDDEEMADAIAAGMIKGLGDEWSYYISAEDFEAYQESVNNAYVGIGVVISAENVKKGLTIVEVTPDSPAFQAGLEKGDLILKVNGTPILDGSENSIDLNETKNRVRGQEGTDVTLTVSHDDEVRDVTITRKTIKTVNVSHEMLDNGLLYIRIRNFEKDSAQDTLAALEDGLSLGASGIIFDVRFNPGGFKNELVEVLDYLLPEGPLFRSVDYSGREEVDRSDADCLDLPMAVLVNYDSYSAAEFFAAALQEYEAAVIVGEQTYGKGRFQTIVRLSDGSAINLSIGQYTTPNGVSLVGRGITPDFPVDLTLEEKQNFYYGKLEQKDDKQLRKAIEVLTNP